MWIEKKPTADIAAPIDAVRKMAIRMPAPVRTNATTEKAFSQNGYFLVGRAACFQA